jgi:hypothetical protein
VLRGSHPPLQRPIDHPEYSFAVSTLAVALKGEYFAGSRHGHPLDPLARWSNRKRGLGIGHRLGRRRFLDGFHPGIRRPLDRWTSYPGSRYLPPRRRRHHSCRYVPFVNSATARQPACITRCSGGEGSQEPAAGFNPLSRPNAYSRP